MELPPHLTIYPNHLFFLDTIFPFFQKVFPDCSFRVALFLSFWTSFLPPLFFSQTLLICAPPCPDRSENVLVVPSISFPMASASSPIVTNSTAHCLFSQPSFPSDFVPVDGSVVAFSFFFRKPLFPFRKTQKVRGRK